MALRFLKHQQYQRKLAIFLGERGAIKSFTFLWVLGGASYFRVAWDDVYHFPFLNEELFGTPESLKPKGSLGYTFYLLEMSLGKRSGSPVITSTMFCMTCAKYVQWVTKASSCPLRWLISHMHVAPEPLQDVMFLYPNKLKKEFSKYSMQKKGQS